MLESGSTSREVLEKIGGASRDRTDDLIVANDALSQLSYSPVCRLDRLMYFNSLPESLPSCALAPSQNRQQISLTNYC
jgi:hypothetical protein